MIDPPDPVPPVIDPPKVLRKVKILSKGRIKVGTNGVAPVKIRCAAANTDICKVKLALWSGYRLMAKKMVKVSAGKKVTVKVKLNKSARRVLRGRGLMKATLRATTYYPDGKSEAKRRLKLKYTSKM